MSESGLPPLNWLRAFEASARHLSFTGAGTELGLTQSAISQQIKALEGYLGRPLFHRRTRRLELTEAGRNYLPVVQEAFGTLAQGTRSLLGMDRGRVLHVRSNLAFAVFVLAPRLDDLHRAHPWLRLHLTTGIWEPEPREGVSDVEIRFSERRPVADGTQRLSNDCYYPVTAPDYVLPHDPFATAPLFDVAAMRPTFETWLRAQGGRLSPDRAVTYASTYAVTLSAAQAGAGIAMAHDTVAADLIARGLLVAPFDHREPMQDAYWLIPADPARDSPAARAFCAWLADAVKKTPDAEAPGASLRLTGKG